MNGSLRVVLAPDKFKGTLTAQEVRFALAAGLRSASAGIECIEVPVSDGGDGSLEVAFAQGYLAVEVLAADALGRVRPVVVAVRGQHAIVELAAVCGLHQIQVGGHRSQPEACSTLGLGQAIRGALDAGCTTLTIGIGGSASTDGGLGMLCGLGARLLDENLSTLGPSPNQLHLARSIDLGGLDSRLSRVRIEFATDVDAPLLGSRGTAAMFSPQKGAERATVRRLEEAMRHWACLLRRHMPQLDTATPGSGAGGGTGFAAAVIGGVLVNGAEFFLDLAGYDDQLVSADLVITGEGRLDRGTLMGKAPAVVARRAARAGVACLAVVGSASPEIGDDELRAQGIAAVHQLIDLDATAGANIEASRSVLHHLGAQIGSALETATTRPHPTRLTLSTHPLGEVR